MAQSDKYMADHVRSAKVWLEKAEQSFNSQADIKGELNLMLAQAEMKNLRKKKGATAYVKYVAAAILAVGCVAGVGFWWAWQHEAPQPAVRNLPPVAEEAAPPAVPPPDTAPAADWVPPIEAAPADLEGSAYVPAQPEAVPAPEPAPAAPPNTVAAVPPPVVTPAEEMPVLTDRQMQAAVQDARHTLRSTAKEIK